jgi:hypothetical protein
MNPKRPILRTGGYCHLLSLSAPSGVSGLKDARVFGDDGPTAIDEEEG